MTTRLLVEARPGAGKTTAARRLVGILRERGVPVRVGKYGVDLGEFERVALPSLGDPAAGGVVVIDELGKMELASGAFRDAVRRLLDSPCSFVATVHVHRHPFTDTLKRQIEVVRLDAGNRDRLPGELAGRLAEAT